MLTLGTEQYLTENRERLEILGYNERQIQAVAHCDAMSVAKHSPEAGNEILKRVMSDLGKIPLFKVPYA